MIVQTRKKHKNIGTKHICGTGTAVNQSDKKRVRKGRKCPKDLLKCGSCNITFETICSLHVHCTQHGGQGSYYFDNLISTAFPKYGTACAFTQVTTELLDLESLRDSKGASFQAVNSNVPRRETPARQSKSQAKLNKIWVASEKRKRKHVNNFEIDEKCSIHSKGTLETDKTNINCPDQGKAVPELNTDLLPSPGLDANKSDIIGSLIKDEKVQMKDNTESGSKNQNSKDTTHSKCIAKKSRKNNKTDKDFIVKTESVPMSEESHKTDELTAGEMLIAISKGVSAQGRDTTGGDIFDPEKSKTREETSCEVEACRTEVPVTNVQDDLVEKKVKKIKAEKMATKLSKKKKAHSNKSKSVGRKYKCSTCGKVGGQTLMHYHKYMHREKKDFTCETCGSSFKHPRCLQLHQKQHEEKQFKCEICLAAFHRRQYLVTHMMKHTGEEPYMCDICGKSYRDKNGLSRHIRHVHEKVRNYECDICKERFFRSDHLKNHRLRHAEADKKCPYCSRMFKHPDDLLRHTKTHTGEKKWHCNICGHGFVSVSPYYVHMYKKHGMNREDAKVLKKQLQEEHKLRLQGVSTEDKIPTSKKDASSETGPHRHKPVIQQVLKEAIDASDQTDKSFTNIAAIVPTLSHHKGMQSDFKEISQVQFNLESSEIVAHSAQVQEVSQYLLNLGNNDLSGNQTVVLGGDSSLDHLEIEISEVEDGVQLSNIELVDGQTVMFVGDHIAEEVVIQGH